MAILRELWTKEERDQEETQLASSYVIELKNRIEETCKLVHRHLWHSGERYKKHFDRKARARTFKAGDQGSKSWPSTFLRDAYGKVDDFIIVDFRGDEVASHKTFGVVYYQSDALELRHQGIPWHSGEYPWQDHTFDKERKKEMFDFFKDLFVTLVSVGNYYVALSIK